MAGMPPIEDSDDVDGSVALLVRLVSPSWWITTGVRYARRRCRLVGLALNALIRASIISFLIDVLRHPDDPRFAGKAIPGRNLVIVGSLSLLFPVLYLWRRRWPRYPLGHDNLYLSIYWLDMAGNAFGLYNRFTHFDLFPHAHGTGATAAMFLGAFDLSPLQAMGAANAIHVLLEAQEYATDVFFGTHNVRGRWDIIDDVVAGLLGSALYVGAYVESAHDCATRW